MQKLTQTQTTQNNNNRNKQQQESQTYIPKWQEHGKHRKTKRKKIRKIMARQTSNSKIKIFF